MIRIPLKVNTMSEATLGPIGIVHLELKIDDQNFTHIFCVHKIETVPNLRT